MIAYVKSVEQLKEFWPEAADIDVDERVEITYTDRFPKPSWYESDES